MEDIKQSVPPEIAVRVIRLFLDNDTQIYLSLTAFSGMNMKNEPDTYTIKEYVDCIKNVEQYFDEE